MLNYLNPVATAIDSIFLPRNPWFPLGFPHGPPPNEPSDILLRDVRHEDGGILHVQRHGGARVAA